jgi:hypothetical protein
MANALRTIAKLSHVKVCIGLQSSCMYVIGDKNKDPALLTQAGSFSDQARQAGLTCVVQWNCSSSVEPVRALTLDEPPWITVVTSSK